MVKAKLASTALLIVMAHNKRPHGTKCNLSKILKNYKTRQRREFVILLVGRFWWKFVGGKFLVENLLVENCLWKILCPLACFLNQQFWNLPNDLWMSGHESVVRKFIFSQNSCLELIDIYI